MRPVPRALRLAVSGAVAVTALVACGTVTIRHDVVRAVPAPAAPVALTPAATSTSGPGAAPPVTSAAPTAEPLTVRPGTLLLGDSVMLGAKAELKAPGRAVNAVESRQFRTGLGIVKRAVALGTLPLNLVMHLGTNGSLEATDCRAVIDTAGPDRRVFLVTPHAPRSWIASDIAHLRQCVAAYPAGRVVLVDWHGPAAKHPAWFYADGIHLNGRGRTAYAALITATLAQHSS